MNPKQMILIMAGGLAVVYFLTRKQKPLVGAIGNNALGNNGALNTMTTAYEWTAQQNQSLASQVASLTAERDVFKNAYEWAAK